MSKLLLTWKIKNKNELNEFAKNNKLNNNNLCSYKKQFYNLLTYNKYFINEPTTRFYKSILLDNNGKILSIFLPKSISYNNIIKAHKIIPKDFYLEEFVPGINLNLFYDNNSNNWDLHSRYDVSCKIKLKDKYSLSIRELFYDICHYIKFDFNKLNKNYVYSFTIQDPYISNYYNYYNKKLYLVNIFEIITVKNIQEIRYFDSIVIKNNSNIILPSNKIFFPKIINEELNISKELFNIQNGLLPFDTYGYMFKSITFPSFSKIINPYYKIKYNLYRFDRNIIYFYILLRYTEKTSFYLKIYNENRMLFSEIRASIHFLTNIIYEHYVNIYIKKKYKLQDINDNNLKYYLNKIHKNYLSELIKSNKIVDKKYVINFINKLYPSDMYYLLTNI